MWILKNYLFLQKKLSKKINAIKKRHIYMIVVKLNMFIDFIILDYSMCDCYQKQYLIGSPSIIHY